ncbi:MAG: S-layer homology domain-containing protein [Thermotogae bacterium]|nr:S-layer homology domain-containing protein [Thermotogota bacterium]
MKKISILIMVSMLLFSLLTAEGLPLKDVPATHWAYSAVKELLEKNIISGMPDGTYKGEEPVTRYQMAVVIKNAIDYLESSPKFVKQEDVQALQALVDAMAKQIGENNALVKELKQKLENLAAVGSQVQQSEKLAELSEKLEGLSKRLSWLEIGYSSQKESVEKAFRSLKELGSKMITTEELSSLGNELGAKINKVAMDVAKLKTDFDLVDGDVNKLYSKISNLEEKSGNFATKDEFKDFAGRLEGVSKRLSWLEMTLPGKVENLEKAFNEMEKKFASSDELMALGNELGKQIRKTALEVAKMKTDSELFDKDITKLYDKISDLEKGISDLNAKVEKIDIKTVNQDLVKLYSRVAALDSKIRKFVTQDDIEALKKEIDVETIDRDLVKLYSRVAALEFELKNVSSKLKAITEEAVVPDGLEKKFSTKEELLSLGNELGKQIRKTALEVARMKTDNELFDKDITKLYEKTSVLDDKIKKLEKQEMSDVVKLKERIINLEQSTAAFDGRINSLTGDLDSLKSEISDVANTANGVSRRLLWLEMTLPTKQDELEAELASISEDLNNFKAVTNTELESIKSKVEKIDDAVKNLRGSTTAAFVVAAAALLLAIFK